MKNSGMYDHDQSKERIKQTEEAYRDFYENAIMGIAQVALEGKYLNANRSLARMHGFESPEEMIGSINNIGQELFVNPEDFKGFIKILKTKNILKGYEIQLYRKDKSKIWLSMNIRTVRDASGKILYYECIAEDITERKRLESQFIQSQKMEAVGTLAGGIAHDFNNLLMGIQGYASLVLYSMEPNHPHYDKLKSIEDLVRNGADLTRQLLGFARGGKYEVKQVDLNEVIHKTSTMFGRTKKDITVHYKKARDIYIVEVDHGQIEQVMFNLYVNAWQSMPAGGDLYIETKNITLDEGYVKPYTVKPGEYVKVSVTDTGPGMDERTRERIFEPFFTTKEMGRGSGLGLASIYGIIKNHLGFINVYSEKGHGTTFNVYLPALVKEVERNKKSVRAIKGSENILIVDDEAAVISVCRELLETLGYKVITASSGEDAVEIYRSKKEEIDIVILDMIMPDIGGGEAFALMKIINPYVKVILSSGYSLNGQAAGIMKQGCKSFIQKPFSIDELSKKVREVLDSNYDEER
ncbi:MAG: response regulator [Proteobacteria bacterium]|nr:response regulator [Pseudomonadota bacterium]